MRTKVNANSVFLGALVKMEKSLLVVFREPETKRVLGPKLVLRLSHYRVNHIEPWNLVL